MSDIKISAQYPTSTVREIIFAPNGTVMMKLGENKSYPSPLRCGMYNRLSCKCIHMADPEIQHCMRCHTFTCVDNKVSPWLDYGNI